MAYKDLCPEDQEALRRIVSRGALTRRQLGFLTRLIASMHRSEQRDYQVMCEAARQRRHRKRTPYQFKLRLRRGSADRPAPMEDIGLIFAWRTPKPTKLEDLVIDGEPPLVW